MAKKETNEPSKIDAALQRFSDMLIKRMEEMKLDWHKGWTGGKAAFGLPQNITGRTYEGSNAFLLFLHTSQNNYKAPVYMTIPQAKNEGIRINRGEKSVPVFKWGLSIKDKDGKRLSEEDFHNMSEEEKKECLVRPYLKAFNEFNIDQTNLKEVNKEKYDAILARFHNPGIMVQSEGMYVNKALDRMMEKQEWVCNIQYDKEEPGAYYSPSKDIVVIPTKAQFRLHPDNPEECFKDGQEYYGTALHEMAHSTGHPSRLNRLDNSRFGDPAYAKEELVAELTSAMVGNTLGFDRRISDNNAAYLQSWISVLRKEPKFISSVMSDVNKASRMIIENIDKQRVALGEKPLIQGSLDGTEEKVKNDQQLEDIKTGKESEDPKEAVAKQWASFAEKPTLEMPTGETLTVDYNKDNDTLDVLITNEDGKQEVHSTNYDHDRSLEENIGYVNEELTNLSQYQVKEEKESQDAENGNGLTPKEYFQTLITTLADGQHDEHTASSIKSLTELRDYYKDKPELADWVATASDKELVEAGADMLPNLRYSHKEGRTLYDIETAFSNINAKYEDVTDDRTRQIAHRIEQAKSIISAYHDNIEQAKGKDYLSDQDSAHKLIPREEYAKNLSQELSTEHKQETMEEKYYFSHTYLQSTDSSEELDKLMEEKDYKGLLNLTKEYDQGDALEQGRTYKKAEQNRGDDLLDEDDHYAIVYNGSVGGTYDLMRKVTKQEILDNIQRYGLNSDATDDVKKIAYEDIARQFSEIKKSPSFEMPNGSVVNFQYNQEKNQIEAGGVTNIGIIPEHTFEYDVEFSLDENLQNVYEQLSELPEYQQVEEEDVTETEEQKLEDNTFLNQEKNDEQMEKYADVSAKLNDSPFPYFNMPNGEQLKYQFDNDSKNIVVGKPSQDGTFNEVYRQFYDTDKTIAENMSSVYAALSQKEEFQVKPKEQAVPHEDSNVDTNVTGLAESIAETGVPMEQAEKEAKEVVDDKQHESYHEEETKRQQQAEQEKAKEQEAKAKQEKKEGETPEKTLVHASLLLGALAAAKENEGVWMNKDYKSNAEFMFSKTPITAYNNVMMNLESDQKGYRSNVYTYYKNAEENGASIKHGEKSLPFNWTQWEYQNVTNKEDIISSNQYKLLSDDKKADYVQCASRLTQHIYNIDQTTFPAVSKEKYAEVVEEKGAKGEEWKVKETHNLSADFDKLKEKHPDALILVRVGDFYETYGKDAKRAAEILNLTVTKSNGRDLAGFPYHALDTYLPRLIRAGERIAITESFVPTKASKEETNRLHERGEAAKAVLSQANTLAKQVMEQSGGKYERIMVLQETRYDKDDDKLVVSGIRDNGIGNKYVADIQKTNDIYRAVVAATGTESRLDRSGRNNLLPEDDAKHERLVQEIAAGVLMARQGLPATLSKESQKLIPYWEREIKENPKMVGVIERDVNNAIETIDNLAAKRKVNYEAIRGQLPTKLITEKPKNYTIATDLAKLPSMETKEIVLVKDVASKHADVVLPAGASLEVDNEVPGMRKDRIAIALKKEGFEDVKFYNAGGSLGLNKSNDYFQGKEVSVNQLKQYQLVNHKTIDVADRAKLDMNVEIVKFGAVKDNNGKYAFCIKAKDEPSFSVYPPKEHLNTFFNVRNTPQEKSVREALAQKWYDVASNHPEIKVDAISPRKVDVDMSKIERPTIARSANNFNEKLVFATINGERKSAPITESQWQKMWYANDMAAYKKGIAAIAFEPLLKQSVENQQGETVKETVKETEKVEVKDSPAPKQEQDEQVKQTTSHRMHI